MTKGIIAQAKEEKSTIQDVKSVEELLNSQEEIKAEGNTDLAKLLLSILEDDKAEEEEEEEDEDETEEEETEEEDEDKEEDDEASDSEGDKSDDSEDKDEKEEDESDVKSLIKSLIDADHDFDGKLKVIEIDSKDTGELPGFESIYDSLLHGGWWSYYVSVKLISKQTLFGPKINIRKWIYQDCIKQIKLN